MKASLGEKLGVAGLLLILVLGIGGAVGWGLNIYKFVKCDFAVPLKEEAIRGVCIPIWPAGMIVGYLSIDDTPRKEVE